MHHEASPLKKEIILALCLLFKPTFFRNIRKKTHFFFESDHAYQ